MNVKHHFLGRGNYLLSPCPVTSSYWDKSEKGAGRSGSFLLCTSATFHISLLVLPPLTSTSLLLDLEREQYCERWSWSLSPFADHHQNWSQRLSWQSDPQNGKSCCLWGLLQVPGAAEQVSLPEKHKQWILPFHKSSRPGWAGISQGWPQVTLPRRRQGGHPKSLPTPEVLPFNGKHSQHNCSSWWQHLHHGYCSWHQ